MLPHKECPKDNYAETDMKETEKYFGIFTEVARLHGCDSIKECGKRCSTYPECIGFAYNKPKFKKSKQRGNPFWVEAEQKPDKNPACAMFLRTKGWEYEEHYTIGNHLENHIFCRSSN